MQPFLKIAIAATARSMTEADLLPAMQTLTNWGYSVQLAENIGLASHQFAGSDAQRIHSLQALLDDETLDFILFARGGYGTVRILDQADFTRFKQHPKLLIGFSDLTALFSHVLNHLHIPVVHGPMALNFQPQRAHEESLSALQSLLSGEPIAMQIPEHPLNKNASFFSGELIGGNLSVLYSILGSNSDMDFTDKVLFLEDLDEYLYHIDRMLMGLKRAGKLSQLKGLLVGNMSDMKDNETPFGNSAEEIILDVTSTYDYPVIFGLPCGHEKKNLPLLLGSPIHIQAKENSIYLTQEGIGQFMRFS